MDDLTVACVLRTGGDFDASWVRALHAGVSEHLSIPHDFVCLTDDMESVMRGVQRIALRHEWPKWWPKIELFRADLFSDRVLYIDLDSLPVGSLDDLAKLDAPFVMLTDFYRPTRVASGVLAWTPSRETAEVYERFVEDADDIMAGHRTRMDHWLESVIRKPARFQELLPGQIVSLKAHARKVVPEGARLVCGHGPPRFSHVDAGWAHTEWTRRAA